MNSNIIMIGLVSALIASFAQPSIAEAQSTQIDESTESARATQRVEEPAYDLEFLYLDSVTGRLSGLEKAQANTNVKTGFMSAAGYWELAGSRSAIRFSSNVPLSFVIRGLPQNLNPEDQITLRKYESTRSTRRFKINKSNMAGAKMLAAEGKVPLRIERYGTASLKITPVTLPLEPGEYVLASVKNPLLKFCFGVDASPL